MESASLRARSSLRGGWIEPKRRLVALSFLMLFVELALIRWSAANVVYLAYFTNFVLLASFLGIGVGFLRAKAPRDNFRLAPWAVAAYVAFVLLFPVTVAGGQAGRTFEGLFGMFALPPWIALPAIFAAVTAVMAFIAEGVARAFRVFEPLEAYRLDIVGSILGIAGFTVLAFGGVRPVVWGVVVAVLFVLLLERPLARVQAVALVAIVGLLGLGSLSARDHWSPYYRVSVSEAVADGRVGIEVNGLPHQSILPLDELREVQPFYWHAYDHLPEGAPLDDVLVVGAGNGNDVAVALSQGAGHVDAVEIDPVLQGVGERLHPAAPYQDPRVTPYIDDGRAFLERTDRRYDLILFALPDSLTLVSGQGSLRLESYLFTEEAMTSVRDHLEPGGAFAMYNYYRPFVFDRFAGTLEQVFGHPPCLDQGQDLRGPREQAVLTVGLEPDAIICDTTWTPQGARVAAATDDHPFPYVRDRSIPAFYAVTLLLILLASALLVRRVAGPLRGMRGYADLFCMGAAFLLLETKNVVQFALLFGTTWFVNALVFAGILLSVLAAIEVTRRFRLPDPRVLYAALFAALGLAYLTPLSSLLGLAPVPRFAAAVALAFAPIFLANLIFSQRFKDVGSSTVAFGANLLGAMVGGVLEYAALVTGYRALLIAVALLYAAALALGRRAEARATAASVRPGSASPAA